MIRIIGLTGKKGAGKTTATKKIKEVLESRGYTVIECNFKGGLIMKMQEGMDGLLADVAHHYGVTVHDLFETKPPIMRNLMQQVGTEVYRAMDTNYWVNIWAERVGRHTDGKVVIITDDVRFNNEFAKVTELGGIVYRIVASNKEVSSDQHQSEIEMDGFDCETITADSKEDLEEKIMSIL